MKIQRRWTRVYVAIIGIIAVLLSGCSGIRNIPEGKYLLDKNIIKTNRSELRENINAVIKQKPNRKIFGVFRFHLGVYNLANRGKSTKIKEWFKKNIGEEPVILDTLLTKRSTQQLGILFQKSGYFNAVLKDSVIYVGKRAKVVYEINSGSAYQIRYIKYKISDKIIDSLVQECALNATIKKGDIYVESVIQKERERVNKFLRNKGFYGFNIQYIRFSADSSLKSNQVDLEMIISNPVQSTRDSIKTIGSKSHLKSYIKDIVVEMEYDPILQRNSMFQDTLLINGVNFISKIDTSFLYKPKRLLDFIFIKRDSLFSQDNIDLTYQRLADLGIFKFVTIKLEQMPISDSITNLPLRCYILLSPQARQEYKLEAEGTNSGGNLGVSGTVVYRNKNMFRGAELFEFKFKGGLEVQRNLNNNKVTELNQLGIFNTYEIGPEISLTFPRALWPFKIQEHRTTSNVITAVSTGYNLQNRPEYYRRLANVSYYHSKKISRFNRVYYYPVELNYLEVNLDSAFSEQLASLNDINLISGYTDQLIANGRFSYIYNNQIIGKQGNFTYFRLNIEFAGNTLALLTNQNFSKTINERKEILNIPYAQYLRPDFDLRQYKQFNKSSSLAARLVVGLGYSYGNSYVLPFEKAFYAGGPNDIRAWGTRRLGPGSSVDGDFFERFGEFKVTSNVEYRFDIIRFFKGAFFADAGNIWLLNKSTNIQGGKLNSSEFLSEIAIGAGFGLRADFSFFILRLDGAIEVKDPSHDKGERWVMGQNKIGSIIYNFGIGYPF